MKKINSQLFKILSIVFVILSIVADILPSGYVVMYSVMPQYGYEPPADSAIAGSSGTSMVLQLITTVLMFVSLFFLYKVIKEGYETRRLQTIAICATVGTFIFSLFSLFSGSYDQLFIAGVLLVIFLAVSIIFQTIAIILEKHGRY